MKLAYLEICCLYDTSLRTEPGVETRPTPTSATRLLVAFASFVLRY